MQKPRCVHCKSATKRVYERKGSKAQFNGINRWWYCPNCMKMQLGPQLPSMNKEEYLHPDGAKVYPKIAKILEENFSKSGYEHMNELDLRINSTDRADTKTYYMFNQILNSRTKARKNEKQELAAYWYCSSCETLELANEIKENEKRIHCNKEMKITVKPVPSKIEIIRNRRKEMEKDYLQLCSENNFEESGNLLLDIVLHNLAFEYEVTKNSRTFELFLKEAKNGNTNLLSSWGFLTTLNILQVYRDDKLDEELKLAFLAEKYEDIQVGRCRENASELLSDIFSDIQLRYSNDLNKLPKYRFIFNEIKNNLFMTLKLRQMVGEMKN